MKNDVFLKKSLLGGYNKAETLIYIDEMQAMLEKTRKEKDGLSLSLNNNTTSLDKCKEDFIQQVEQMEAQIKKLNEMINSLTSENDILNSKVNDLLVAKQASDKQLRQISSQNNKLCLDNERLTERLKRYDDMKESIIKLQVDARSRAREILSAAEKDSKQILDTVSNYEKNPY